MSLFDAAIVLALIVLVILLIRASHVIGSNLDQQIKEQETLASPFPPGTTRTEKLRLMYIFPSIAANDPKRVWAIAIATVIFLLWLVVLQ